VIIIVKRLAIRSWLLAISNWQLAISNWQLATGDWQLATGNWRLATGSWQKPNTLLPFRFDRSNNLRRSYPV